jgi:tRNA 5-methylaminomethyl-2-thiouridine biosynthesis bifunctional protein
MKQIGIVAAPLRFSEAGLPVSDPFGQPYLPKSAGGAPDLSLVSHAAIDQILYDIPAADEPISVLEIGFGIGTNLLDTVASYEQTRQHADRSLNYVAFEQHPLSRDDLAKALVACHGRDRNVKLADALLAHWPPLVHGAHRIRLSPGIELTLIFADASKVLTTWQFAADLLILDAYSAKINPPVWSDEFIRVLAAHCKPGATLISAFHDAATREQLSRVGYQGVQTSSGKPFIAKYQPVNSLRRSWQIPKAHGWNINTRSAIVVGSGLAGMQCAKELVATGWQVSIVDKESGLTGSPQQQPVVAAHPHFSSDDNPLARLTRAAYLLSRADQQTLSPVGRLVLADDEQLDALAPLLADCPAQLAQRVCEAQASDIAGTSLNSSALWLPEMPIRVSQEQPSPQTFANALGISWLPSRELSDIQFQDGLWHCRDKAENTIGSASIVILATGHLPPVLQAGQWPGVLTHQGQSTSIQSDGIDLQCVVGGSSYAAPLRGRHQILAGASTVDEITDLALNANDHRNRDRLAQLLDCPGESLTVLKRHLGMRSTTRDHLPMIGPMPDVSAIAANAQALSANDRLPLPKQPGLYLATGFGGRGLLWSYLAARCITDHVNSLTSVLPTSLEQAVAPNRFIRRALRQGQYRAPPVTGSTR